MLAVIGTILGISSAALGSLAAGVTAAWQASGLSRGRRTAARAIRPVGKEARRVERTLRRWEGSVQRAATEFAARNVEERLAAIEIESLRDAGAANVRWSLLREAGYTSLADLVDVPPRKLAEVKGIGKKSAASVVGAAREMIRRIRAEATDTPRADLEQAGAEPLAEASLDYLEARDAGGDAPRRVLDTATDFERRLDGVRRDARFGAWVKGVFDRPARERSLETSSRLARDASEVAGSGLLEESRAARKRMRKWRRPKRDPAQMAERFRQRYAECCALLERLFVKFGLRRARIREGQGGLTDEVARRVESFPLRTSGMQVSLRRYQEFGAKYILAQERTILGDEMGLGKTMQSLAAMTHRHAEDPGARFFVVAPAGLLVNWTREVERFTPLSAFVLHGSRVNEGLEAWVTRGGVAVTSYATLRNLDLGATLEETGGTVDLCVVDEAHFIKNPEAGRTQAVRRLLNRSVHACLMSGTPMENHPGEFLELIDAIRPKDAEELRDSDLDLDAAAGSVTAFHRSVAKIYLRRNQEDVLSELPEKIEVPEWVELSAAERADFREKVRERNFMGMRQAATISPSTGASAKLDRLEELLADHRASGRKVLVFSFFLGVLDQVAERFGAVGIVSGKVSAQEKQALCDEFQSREGHALLALQIQAGGQGFNLQQASVVVLMEPQTKPSTESQAVARAHRMGQTQRVLVHRLLARGTCDETLLAILAEKEELFEAYARRSLVKDASGQATEASLTAAVMAAEEERLAQEEPTGGENIVPARSKERAPVRGEGTR